MEDIQKMYGRLCATPSDINEHLPILREYAEKCSHVTECGVRSIVSSWAFAAAKPARLVSIDIERNPNIRGFALACKLSGISFQFHEQSDLECPIEETDLLFIDTWHVYGHLKRELARWHPHVRKYIVLHDTTLDAELGETIRVGWNAEEQSRATGIPIDEIKKGLWPAIEEFLAEHSEWILHKRYINNNGLTILQKV